MNNRGFQSLSLLLILGLFFLTSCGGPARQVDALITPDGKVSGIFVEYNTSVDKSSITTESYKIFPDQDIARFFVSNSNPYKKIKGNENKYVILLLKEPAESLFGEEIDINDPNKKIKLDVRLKQVSPIVTSSGKTIDPWKKAIKMKNYYVVQSGFSK